MLIILNKDGSLVYNKKFPNNPKNYDANEMLKLASGFYSMHNLAHLLTPDSMLPVETEL